MRYPPISVQMYWPRPNYVNPENRGPTLMIVELTILALALICLALRLWVRIKLLKRFWWDDGLMVGAALCCCGVTVSVILATEIYGWNIHVWDLSAKQMRQGRQVSIAGQTIFLFASGLAKLSILVSYLRIGVVGSWFRRLTWATIAVVTAAIPGFLCLLWLQCKPASSYWNLLFLERDCIPEGPPLMGQTITTVITDFVVYVLPMPTLWQLKLPLAQRLSLMLLFGLGSVVVISGCLRTYWVHYVEFETYDVTWEGFYLWIWAAVEANLGVICGCAPVLKPLVWPSKSSLHSYGRSYGYGKSGITSGADSRQWSRRKRGLSTTDIDTGEGYITLDNLEAGKRLAISGGVNKHHPSATHQVHDVNSSEESLGLPRERMPAIPQSTFQLDGRDRQLFRGDVVRPANSPATKVETWLNR
ncbi:hypothetical protein F4778DRAFT_787260 [Xylariomycetidae sp. FL2044]|nr:hypothetical protein F4778DRAFT_787260 [Xylariomycetidae sp. FL2044]